MKLRNRNQKWSEKDVYILVRLMREQVPYSTIAAVLGRSEASLRHAVKNTLYQQLLHHMPMDVLTYYKMKDDELYKDVVNPVYYQEIETDTEDDSCEDEDEQEEDVNENQNELIPEGCNYIITSVITFLVAAGVATYVSILKDNWLQT